MGKRFNNILTQYERYGILKIGKMLINMVLQLECVNTFIFKKRVNDYPRGDITLKIQQKSQ